ncbi:uncharacterized protein LOC131327149 isoform X2 [Rhododendron vialii]|uniref:uncharacterized protein LOC131327149 isoform X2 n=1 Tax=Rhododendron vialii TaxID=182163 RepID=UPI00265E7F40|nr:uncharacterized protein LOC131327149 isoform X2 [Rhododendron vialii]
MAEDLCIIIKDTRILNASKKSPSVLRMIVLTLAMVCGIYICSICMEQISTRANVGFTNVEVIKKPCEEPNIESWEKRYVRYPNPKTFSRAECACNPVRYFAILSTQRSGSGWFETLLNSHPNISSNGEIFSVKVRRSNISTIVETLDNVYNLDLLTSASKNECTAAVGLKWMLNQEEFEGRQGDFSVNVGYPKNHKEIVEYFNATGVSTIFLFRRNLLRRMISILANSYDQNAKPLNGTHKSHVHSPHEAAILARYKPTINVKLLIPNLREVEEMVTKSLEYFKSTRHIILYYEDIIKNHTKLTEVQDFLKVPRIDLNSRQVKIHKGSLSRQVENWADIKKTLKGTSYESFLHADYTL